MPSTPDTEARIREAALRLFAQHGYAATGIREVARDAGVTTAAMYHYMGGKQDLLMTIMRESMHGLIGAARDALQDVNDPVAQLAAMARAHIIFNGHNLLETYVSDTEIRSLDGPNRARIVKLRDQYEDMWAEVIERGIESGAFRVGDRKLFRLAVIQVVNSVAYWYSPTGERSLPAIADEFAGFALAMAGCDPRPAEPGRSAAKRRSKAR